MDREEKLDIEMLQIYHMCLVEVVAVHVTNQNEITLKKYLKGPSLRVF